jgi:polar amino acid transport system substrate-binding protein
MKKTVFFLIILSLHFSLAAQNRKIILTSQDLPPLGYYDNNGNYDGIAVKVVRYALDRMKVDYEILVYPWARAQNEVKNNKADGFFAGSRNAERDSYAVMSEIIADQNWVWYQLKDNPMNPKDPAFKKKATVGSYLGANMLDWLIENKYRVRAKPKNTELLIKMLLAKRVDAVLANNLVAGEIIKRDGLSDRLKTTIEKEKPLGVYFSKKFIRNNPGFLQKFNGYIKEYFR